MNAIGDPDKSSRTMANRRRAVEQLSSRPQWGKGYGGLSLFYCLLFYCSTALIFACGEKLEAWGFEPQSRDNIRGGHYMLIRCFDLDPGNEHRHPSPGSSRLKSRPPTNGRIGEPGSRF